MHAHHTIPSIDRKWVASSAEDLKLRVERVMTKLAKTPDKTREDVSLHASLSQTYDTLGALLQRLED